MAASIRRSAPVVALALAVASLGAPAPLSPQASTATEEAGKLQLRVEDARLARALSRLLAGSPTADAVVSALTESGLPVSIGTPGELTDPSDGTEVSALLPDVSGLGSAAEPQLAWIALRVAPPDGAAPGMLGRVERAWVVVDVDRIEALMRAQGRADAETRIEDDLTIALAHELVAHVGSVARTRRLEDFCDDPLPGAGPTGSHACSLRVENQVRRELNRHLELEGARRYAVRRSYGLDAMNFAGAAH